METATPGKQLDWLTTVNVWLSAVAGAFLIQKLVSWYVTWLFATQVPLHAHRIPAPPTFAPFVGLIPMGTMMLSRLAPPRGRAGRILLTSAIAGFGVTFSLLTSYDPISSGSPPAFFDIGFACFFGLAFVQMLGCLLWDAHRAKGRLPA
jgi:hypothetical protein